MESIHQQMRRKAAQPNPFNAEQAIHIDELEDLLLDASRARLQLRAWLKEAEETIKQKDRNLAECGRILAVEKMQHEQAKKAVEVNYQRIQEKDKLIAELGEQFLQQKTRIAELEIKAEQN